MNILQKIYKEPIVHLTIVGLLLFIGYERLNSESITPKPTVALTITPEGMTKRINAKFLPDKSDTAHTMNANEVTAFVTQALNHELLFQEAVSLNMHHSAWVKERLVKQMVRYYEGQFIPTEPSDKILKSYHQENTDRYQTSDRISFEHILVDSRQLADVRSILAKQYEPNILRDKLAPYRLKSLLSSEFRQANREDIQDLLGGRFIDKLMALPTGVWSEPIFSDRGVHVVMLNEITLGNPEKYETIKEKIRKDWIKDQRDSWVKENTALLWQKYRVQLQDYLP